MRRSAITTASGTPARPLALAAYPDQDPRCVRRAFQGGVNFFFFYGPGHASFIQALGSLAGKNRDEIIIATGSGSRKPKTLKSNLRKTLTSLGTDVIDVFFAEYVSPADDLAAICRPGGVLDEFQQWKADGLVRFAGVTVHDRSLAAQLVADPRVDVLMHRFNMAHRKAAEQVFPVALQAQTPVVAFTATRWGSLLQVERPEWPGKPPTATECYRYCLAQRAVKIVLSAPRTVKELAANLGVLSAPPLSKRERTHWERFGDLIRGTGVDHFETRWP